MTKHELDFYKAGYTDARDIFMGRLRSILNLKKGQKEKIAELLKEMEKQEEEYHWEAIQEEFPGITKKEYEEMCERSFEEIRTKFFHKSGYPKLRLVRPAKG